MNTANCKSIERLEVADLKSCPVWEYINDDRIGELMVRPFDAVPAPDLKNKVVAAQVLLMGGKSLWALIGNVDPGSPRATEQFLTLSIEDNGRWFTLARYHDPDYETRGPVALAEFLGMRIDEVFPIRYDIRRWATGDVSALCGAVLSEPREVLSRSEIIALAIG